MKKSNRVAVVTGGNRGIGFEICRQLALQGIEVVLTARKEEQGRAAAQELASAGLPVRYHRLDVAESASIDQLAAFLDREYGRLDILVNNAGIMIDKKNGEWNFAEASIMNAQREILRETMETNVYGPIELTQKLVPLMKRHRYGRIVNVSSGMGLLHDMGGGWPAYRISKTALNAATRIFHSELEGSGILVNSASPGWVRTEMGGEGAPLTPKQGADTIVWLATLPEDGPSGQFFEERERMDW